MLKFFKTLLRLLCFRASKDELLNLNYNHFILGMFFVWIAGMGRHWDDPHAELLQRLGLGSIIYVFVLAAVLYISIFPLKPENWRYSRILIFITLTAPTAFIYALPVEKWYDPSTATQINFCFLVGVATWRTLLTVRFIRVVGGLDWTRALVGLALPLIIIIIVLTWLNLAKTTLDTMGGFRDPSSRATYEILSTLISISLFAFIPILFGYIFLAIRSRRKAKNLSEQRESQINF